MDDLSDTRPHHVSGDTRPVAALRQPVLIRLLAHGMALSLLITAIAGFALIAVTAARREPPAPLTVTLIVDGLSRSVETTERDVRGLLAEQNIEIGDMAVAPLPNSPLAAGMTVIVDDQRPVALTVDGSTSIFRTVIENPRDILGAAGVEVNAGDVVTVNGAPVDPALLADYPIPADRISVRHALTVSLSDAGAPPTEIVTTAGTVGDALADAGVALYLGDIVAPPAETPLTTGLDISIERALPVAITADGVTTDTRTQVKTVGALLAEAGIQLNGLDYAVPPENARLIGGMQVRVVRVTETVEVETIDVPFDTLYQADATLELDTTAVATPGQVGRDERRTRIRYEDGVEVRRFDDGTVRVADPVNQVNSYGTMIVYRTIDTPDGPREYWRKLRMYATSYHPAALGGDDVTATGARLTKGIVAINPRVVSYGTTVYVNGYGEGKAADTGGPRSTPYWIDLGYDDDNYRRWSGWVDVFLLAPPPANIPLRLP
jgi:resuscitation-promoting factor RpfB